MESSPPQKPRVQVAAARLIRELLSHPSGSVGRLHRLGVLSRFLAWQLNKRTLRRPITVRPFAGEVRLRAYPDSGGASGVIYYRYPDWLEMKLLERILRLGDGFIDVGANIGVFALLAHTRVEAAGRVVAFEPSAINAARLTENFVLNGIDTTDVYTCAVGAMNGVVAFNADDCRGSVVGECGASMKGASHKVPIVTLDSLLQGSGTFWAAMKIDVEGHELAVLQGSKGLLERGVGILMIETNQMAPRSERLELQKYLAAHGYLLYALRDLTPTFELLTEKSEFPSNSFAIADPAWVQSRVAEARFVGAELS